MLLFCYEQGGLKQALQVPLSLFLLYRLYRLATDIFDLLSKPLNIYTVVRYPLKKYKLSRTFALPYIPSVSIVSTIYPDF